MVGAALRAFEPHQQPRFQLRARSAQLIVVEIVDRLRDDFAREVHRFDSAVAIGCAAHRDDPRIGERLVPGTDGICEPALLA